VAARGSSHGGRRCNCYNRSSTAENRRQLRSPAPGRTSVTLSRPGQRGRCAKSDAVEIFLGPGVNALLIHKTDAGTYVAEAQLGLFGLTFHSGIGIQDYSDANVTIDGLTFTQRGFLNISSTNPANGMWSGDVIISDTFFSRNRFGPTPTMGTSDPTRPVLLTSYASNTVIVGTDMFDNRVGALYDIRGDSATIDDAHIINNVAVSGSQPVAYFNSSALHLSLAMVTDNTFTATFDTLFQLDCQAVLVDRCVFERNAGPEPNEMDGVVLEIQAPAITLSNSHFSCNSNTNIVPPAPQALPVHLDGISILFANNGLDPSCPVSCPPGYVSPYNNIANCIRGLPPK